MHTCTWSIEQQAPVLASILGEKQAPQAALSGSGLMDYALQSSAGFSMKNKTLSACGMRSEDMGWGVLGNQPLVSRLSSPWSGKAGRQTPSCPGQLWGGDAAGSLHGIHNNGHPSESNAAVRYHQGSVALHALLCALTHYIQNCFVQGRKELKQGLTCGRHSVNTCWGNKCSLYLIFTIWSPPNLLMKRLRLMHTKEHTPGHVTHERWRLDLHPRPSHSRAHFHAAPDTILS